MAVQNKISLQVAPATITTAKTKVGERECLHPLKFILNAGLRRPKKKL